MTILAIFLLLMLILGILSLLFFNQYIQIFGPVKNGIKTSKKIVALSFDDGPNEPYTSEIVNVLNNYNAKATFFIVGENALKSPKTIELISNNNHEIGCHGFSHKFSRYVFEPTLEKELTDCKNLLSSLGAKNIKLIRTPWIMKNPFIFKGIRGAGFPFITGGKYSSLLEPLGASSHKIFTSITKRVRPGDIIIFHDGKENRGGDRSQTVEAVDKLLRYLSDKNYQVVTVSRLLEIEKIT